MHIMQSRRDFLASASLAAAAAILDPRASLADEGSPETTTLRLAYWPNICLAPGDIADEPPGDVSDVSDQRVRPSRE